MALAGERRIAEILVIGDGDALCTPCGGCRQRIREFADPSTVIHIAGPEGVRAKFTLSELLPSSSGRIIWRSRKRDEVTALLIAFDLSKFPSYRAGC